MEFTDVKSSEWGLSLLGQGKIVQGLDDINQCLNVILLTKKGADPLRPLFGCDIFNYVDKPINSVIPDMVREILEAVTLWEPRVTITKISHTVYDGKVTFNITWKLTNSVDTGQLDITYGIR